jgi:hypothetical protein
MDRASGVGKDSIQVVYMHSRLTFSGVWKVFKRKEVHSNYNGPEVVGRTRMRYEFLQIKKKCFQYSGMSLPTSRS